MHLTNTSRPWPSPHDCDETTWQKLRRIALMILVRGGELVFVSKCRLNENINKLSQKIVTRVARGECFASAILVNRLSYVHSTLCVTKLISKIRDSLPDTILVHVTATTLTAAALSKQLVENVWSQLSEDVQNECVTAQNGLYKRSGSLGKLRLIRQYTKKSVLFILPAIVEELVFVREDSAADLSQSLLYTITDVTQHSGEAWSCVLFVSNPLFFDQASLKIQSRMGHSMEILEATMNKSDVIAVLNVWEVYAMTLVDLHYSSDNKLKQLMSSFWSEFRDQVVTILFRANETYSLVFVLGRFFESIGTLVRCSSLQLPRLPEPVNIQSVFFHPSPMADQEKGRGQRRGRIADESESPVRSYIKGTPVKQLAEPTPVKVLSTKTASISDLYLCVKHGYLWSSVTASARLRGLYWLKLLLIDHCVLIAFVTLHKQSNYITGASLVKDAQPSAVARSNCTDVRWTLMALQVSVHRLLRSKVLRYSTGQIVSQSPEECDVGASVIRKTLPGCRNFMYLPLIFPLWHEYSAFIKDFTRDGDILPKWLRIPEQTNLI